MAAGGGGHKACRTRSPCVADAGHKQAAQTTQGLPGVLSARHPQFYASGEPNILAQPGVHL